MKDRRARLRPRDGARNFYYGPIGQVSSVQNIDLFTDELPWLSNKPLSELSPNYPNFVQNVQNAGTNFIGESFANGAGFAEQVQTGNILAPLAYTDGLVWPYTPTINYSQTQDYNSFDPVHTNQEIYSYIRSRAPQITVTGQIAVQNQDDAAYGLACIHFLRAVSKMSFGQNSQSPGTPPPILLFSAYGEYMFNDLPVILLGFTLDYDSQVDYVQIPNTNTYIPSMFMINVQLVVQNTPARLRTYNHEEFVSGRLLKKKGWI